MVRPMRQIEFIGSALDQEGLRSGIKKRKKKKRKEKGSECLVGLVERAQDCLRGWSADLAKAGNFTVKIRLLIRK